MEVNKKNLYNAPEMEVVELALEGVICDSGQITDPDTGGGSWGDGI